MGEERHLATIGEILWATRAEATSRWCYERGIYFGGTTQTTYGFPREIMVADLAKGQTEWMMATRGMRRQRWVRVKHRLIHSSSDVGDDRSL